MSTSSLAPLLVGLASLVAAASASAQVVFSDPDFAPGSYSISTKVISGTVAVNVGSCPDCGPTAGPALHITAVYATDGSYATAVLNSGFVYTPSTQGAAFSIDAQVDKNLFADFVPVSITNSFRPLIEQDGQFYTAVIAGPSLVGVMTTGWSTIGANGMLATGFHRFDLATGISGPESPDFNGSPMTFGLLAVGSLLGASDSLVGADFANYRLAVNAVPEPQVWLLLSLWA